MSRLVKQISDAIAIRFDYEWQEYQVVVSGHPAATYHTDDKRDAFDTAKDMN